MADLFEALFQWFMQTGGFSKPALREDVEREYRQMQRHNTEACVHGKTRLTCHQCYFGGFTREDAE